MGDLNIQKRTKTGNTRLRFEQSIKNEEYLYHLYELFKLYCNSEPKTSNRKPDKLTGLIYSRVYFSTLSLHCFNDFYYLFYNSEGKKILPENISELLTPRGLAY